MKGQRNILNLGFSNQGRYEILIIIGGFVFSKVYTGWGRGMSMPKYLQLNVKDTFGKPLLEYRFT